MEIDHIPTRLSLYQTHYHVVLIQKFEDEIYLECLEYFISNLEIQNYASRSN